MGGRKMKITVDTNVLVRTAVQDDQHQARLAAKALQDASVVAVSLPVLCEFVWVLKRGYKISTPNIVAAIKHLMNSANDLINRPAVEAGLLILEAGGDFADGVIAYKGNWLGAEEFISCDKEAVSMLQSQGHPARLL
jgi:predicted nucleic-acid-binding protein